jgi:hypothetical protein
MKVKEESLIGTLAVIGVAAALAYLGPDHPHPAGRSKDGPTMRSPFSTLYLPDEAVRRSLRPQFLQRDGKTFFGGLMTR